MKYLPLLLILLSCSAPDSASIRVRNDRATKANVQIKTTENTTNINYVEGFTDYQNIASGRIEVKASIKDEVISPEVFFTANAGEKYTIVVTTDSPPTLKVISP
jgi:hypothetical protein